MSSECLQPKIRAGILDDARTWAESEFPAHFPSRGKARNASSLAMTAAASSAEGLGNFGQGSAAGNAALRRRERENAAPGITPFQEWRRLPA